MLRSFSVAAVVAIGLVMPAAAQHISDQDARQAGESVVQAFNKAALATYVTPDGPLFGRAAIQKQFAEDFKLITLEPAKLDRVAMIGDNVRLRDGSWSGVLQSPDGPVHVKGYWATTDLRDGSTWKIRMETMNITLPPPPEAGK
jgi:hypothetical protein